MAKFILICGPQAVGKMTVGQELAKITDLKFMHNHETIDLPLKFFNFSSEPRRRLTDLFRFSILEEVAKSDLEGMIFTYVWLFEDDKDKEFVQKIKDIYEKENDENNKKNILSSLKIFLQEFKYSESLGKIYLDDYDKDGFIKENILKRKN